MEHLIKLGYVFLGAWVLLSIVGIVVFFIIVNGFKKKRDKSHDEFRRKRERCEWCNPDKDGTYLSTHWANPNQGEVKDVSIMFSDSEIQIGINDEKIGSTPINYCPMCGRKLVK